MLTRTPRSDDAGMADDATPTSGADGGADGANPAATQPPAKGSSWQLVQAILALRPRQWTKNLLVFLALVFAGRLLDPFSVARAMLAFAVWCLVSGAVYIFNDLADLPQDRLHPTKRMRPLASGRLRPVVAGVTAVLALLLGGGLTAVLIVLPPDVSLTNVSLSLAPLHITLAFTHPGAALADTDNYMRYGGSGLLFAATIVTYLAINLAYTLRLKHVVLVDVFAIAAGFVLRTMAGAFAVAVHISPWLYLVAILFSLFLALGKRRQELVKLAGGAGSHRPILEQYTPQLLDQLIVIVTASMVMAYSLYTFQGETGNHRLMVTIPFMLYGVFRYMYLIYVRGEGGSPEEVLLRDPHVRASVVLCVIAIALVLYVVPM